jgi:16S rRNA pseudouridine516 synthase
MTMTEQLQGEMLERFLIRNTPFSRDELRVKIRWGFVCVYGQRCHDFDARLKPGAIVTLDGNLVHDTPDRSNLICNKPAGLTCSHAAQDAPLIYDIVPMEYRHPDLHTVGRLDRATTGLLLLSCDGRWQERITSPQTKLSKRYRVTFSGSLVSDAPQRVRDGLMIHGYDSPCQSAELIIEGPNQATVVISEGRHHQVKRMIAALGGKVTALHRDRIGGLELPPDLAPGAMRILRPEEMTLIGIEPS